MAVREWLLTRARPGIAFVTTADGERCAALAAGPQVWTVARIALDAIQHAG